MAKVFFITNDLFIKIYIAGQLDEHDWMNFNSEMTKQAHYKRGLEKSLYV